MIYQEKKEFDDLGINKLNTNTEIKDFFENKNLTRMKSFLTTFDKLNPNEKNVTLKSMDLLSDVDPKPNFRKQCGNLVLTLPARAR